MKNKCFASLLLFLLFVSGALGQKCPAYFPKGTQRTFTTSRPYTAICYISLAATPHLQFMKDLRPVCVADMAYQATIGGKFPNRFAFEAGIGYYNTDRLLEDSATANWVEADFVEINAYVKYYIEKKKYILMGPVVNFVKLNRYSSFNGYYSYKNYYYHIHCIDIGGGMEKKVTRSITAYAEPVLRLPATGSYSYLTYRSALRLSLGMKFRLA